MSSIVLDIEERLIEGQSAFEIAKALNIPINWVFEAQKTAESTGELLSPFATINS